MGRSRARLAPVVLTLDAGALIAIERGDPRMIALLDRVAHGIAARFAVPVNVLAQVWRGGSRQAVLARFLGLSEVEVVVLDEPGARAVGVLCGMGCTDDVVDASVALCARERGGVVVTSDASDLRRIDPSLAVIAI